MRFGCARDGLPSGCPEVDCYVALAKPYHKSYRKVFWSPFSERRPVTSHLLDEKRGAQSIQQRGELCRVGGAAYPLHLALGAPIRTRKPQIDGKCTRPVVTAHAQLPPAYRLHARVIEGE